MTISLNIEERLYNDIITYCKINNLDFQLYLTDIITKNHTINKFGDLNEIIPKIIQEETVEVKKRGRPRKKVDDNEKKNNEAKTNVKVTEVMSNTTESSKENETIEIKPTVKRKRTLKTL